MSPTSPDRPSRLPWVVLGLGLLILGWALLRHRSGPDVGEAAHRPGGASDQTAVDPTRPVAGGQDVVDPAPPTRAQDVAPAPDKPLLVRGRLAERGGHRPTLGVLEGVRLEVEGARADRTGPGDDGAFLLKIPPGSAPVRLKVRVAYHAYHGEQKVVDEAAEKIVSLGPLKEGVADAGVVELPEGPGLGWIAGTAYATNGSEVRLDGLDLESDADVHGRRIRFAPDRSRFGHPPNVPAGAADGNRFAALHLPGGAYRLTLTAEGYGRVTLPVRVVPGQGADGVTVLMDPGRVALLGRIDDEATGFPVEGATVEAQDGGALLAGSATSAADGRFWMTLRSVPPSGELRVVVEKRGYVSRTLSVAAGELSAGLGCRRDVRLRRSP